MTKAQAVALIGLIKAAFPRADFSPATVSVYADQLLDVDAGIAKDAVSALIASSEWPPTIAAIRNKAADLIIGAPTVGEAFALAETSAPEAPPVVRSAKRLVGDSWFWHTEPRYRLHRMFEEAYQDVLREERRTIVERRQQRALAAQPAIPAASEDEPEVTSTEESLERIRELQQRING